MSGSIGKQHFFGGDLLIAMPDMADPRFKKCVILLIVHSENDAMGVVVNKPAGQVQIHELTQDEDEQSASAPQSIPVHYGGPVEHERAIIVHSPDCREYESMRRVNEHFCVTTTPDILEDFSRGSGPSSRLFVLGYAGWRSGQLEDELQRNAWLVCRGDPELVFDIEPDRKWEAAIKSLGINPSMLSSGGGTA